MRIVSALALGACLTAAVAVGPAWGEPLWLIALASYPSSVSLPPRWEDPRPASGLTTFDLVSRGDRPAGPLDARRFSLTVDGSHTRSSDLRMLVETGERWHLVKFGVVANPRPLRARITVYAELPYVAADPWGPMPMPGDPDEPAFLGVRGETGGFEVGVEYRSVGKRLERIVKVPGARKDRRGHEVWMAQRLGLLRVRLSQSRLSSNVDRNPALPRTTEEQTAVTAEWAIPSWPVLGLTYAVGDSERQWLTPERRARGPERREFERVTGATSWAGAWWEVVASSTLTQSRHVVQPHTALQIMSHDLSLSLRPVDAVTIVPAVSLDRARYRTARSETGSASLGLVYTPSKSRWSASSVLSATTTRTSEGAVDERSLSVHGALGYDLRKLFVVPSTLSLEAGYDRYLDAVYSRNSSTAVSVFLLLKVAAF